MQALRAKRAAEQLAEDAGARINELTTINVNLSSVRAKLEQELAAYASDYEEATKELKVKLRDKSDLLYFFSFKMISSILFTVLWKK